MSHVVQGWYFLLPGALFHNSKELQVQTALLHEIPQDPGQVMAVSFMLSSSFQCHHSQPTDFKEQLTKSVATQFVQKLDAVATVSNAHSALRIACGQDWRMQKWGKDKHISEN